MATPLAFLKKGAFPSFLDSVFGNKVIKAVNDLREAKIAPAGMAQLVVADSGVILDLSPLVALITKIQTAQDATTQTTAPGSGSGSGGGGTACCDAISSDLTALTTRVTVIESRLNSASISAVCNGDGTITVTLTI